MSRWIQKCVQSIYANLRSETFHCWTGHSAANGIALAAAPQLDPQEIHRSITSSIPHFCPLSMFDSKLCILIYRSLLIIVHVQNSGVNMCQPPDFHTMSSNGTFQKTWWTLLFSHLPIPTPIHYFDIPCFLVISHLLLCVLDRLSAVLNRAQMGCAWRWCAKNH